jgi:hypothetical protein
MNKDQVVSVVMAALTRIESIHATFMDKLDALTVAPTYKEKMLEKRKKALH